MASSIPKSPGSLRNHLDELDRRGELRRVTAPIDPILELGAFSRKSFESNAPAPLFENLEGFPGFRALGGVNCFSSDPARPWARAALGLGLAADTSPDEIVDRFVDLMERSLIPPVVIDAGPVQDNVVTGADVDLAKWPIPLLHDGDGGRYLNTIGVVIARTPDGTWTNWSIARAMVLDRNHITTWTRPFKHFGQIHQMWKDEGKPMPFAIALGAEAAAVAVASMPIAYHVDEVGVIGAWFGEPQQLVQAKTIELDVPAHAEIVFEAVLSTDTYADEGPFGEFPGYFSGSGRELVAEITAITHRNDPIYPIVPAGKPVDDDHTMLGIGGSAEFKHALLARQLPVKKVLMIPESADHLAVVTVSPTWQREFGGTDSAALVARIANVISECKNGTFLTRLLVVDDDIDPADPRDVLWAWATRVHPIAGRMVIEGRLLEGLQMCYTPEERARGLGSLEVLNGIFDPAHGIRISSFADNYPVDVRHSVDVKFADLQGSTTEGSTIN